MPASIAHRQRMLRHLEAQMSYRERILEIAPSYDPRHVEAFMRNEHGTLDHLSADAFASEVAIAVMCIEDGGKEFGERLAKSYGL